MWCPQCEALKRRLVGLREERDRAKDLMHKADDRLHDLEAELYEAHKRIAELERKGVGTQRSLL